MPKTKKVAVSHGNLYLEILGLLISEGWLEFGTLVNLYKTTKQLHVFFFNCRIPLTQGYGRPKPILIDVDGNWNAFWQCRKLEWFAREGDWDYYNIITSLIANGEVELAIQVIRKLGCDLWMFYEGVAANGHIAVKVRFSELMDTEDRYKFDFSLELTLSAPKLSTELLDHFGSWMTWRLREGWTSKRIAKTMICGHSKPGLQWYLRNLQNEQLRSKSEELDEIYKFCQREWNDPEALAIIKVALDGQSLRFGSPGDKHGL
jgi:hypothetical protein